MNHCCDLMTEFVNDSRIPIYYNPVLREYYMPFNKVKLSQLLFYCPWCGIKLPKVLNEEYFKIFYDELHLERAKNLLETPCLPEEFKSDEWWKKRGL